MNALILRAGATAATALMFATSLAPMPAHAEGLVAEANAARSHSDWGAELGGGLNLSSGPFTVRPMAGAFLGDTTRLYVKGEATVTIPAFVEIGAGARLISDHLRAYGTASVPLGPMLRLKGNLGDGYGAVGLSLRL
ncbi:hypothetical protein [Sphingobium aquiterrae]|uniref:hypothetical protein n=1 Tax=Sphingobium aquiterrae TaxID=2038656 RepID=UPI0030162600